VLLGVLGIRSVQAIAERIIKNGDKKNAEKEIK
jgi:hypothetical protein